MNALHAYGYITAATSAATMLAHGYIERSKRLPDLPLHHHAVGAARDSFLGFVLGPILVPAYLVMPIKYRTRCPLS